MKLFKKEKISKSKVVIIFIHRGNAEYLQYSLKRARKANPNARIVLLGDESNDKYNFIEHYNISDYSDCDKNFTKIYEHMSPNPYDYEIFCFLRWFAIRNFMKEQKVEKIFHLDSDVMLYCDIEEISEKLNNYEMTYTNVSGHTSFFNSYSAIDNFCNFIMESYKNNKNRLKEILSAMRKKGIPDGISDMTLFVEYAINNPEKVFDTSRPFEGMVFDDSINNVIFKNYHGNDSKEQIYFLEENGMKRIIFENHIPYSFFRNGEKIRFCSLHFQGMAKKHMKPIFEKEKFEKIKKEPIIKNLFLVRMIFALANLLNYQNPRKFSKMKNRLLKSTGIKIGRGSIISHGFESILPQNVELEEDVALGHNNIFWSFSKIKIGRFVQTARDVTIVSGGHKTDNFAPLENQEVEVGSGCWIGTRVTILGGVKIGKGCIIGAGALVNKDIPDFSIAVGSPAKVIRKRESSEIIIHPSREYSLEELVKL